VHLLSDTWAVDGPLLVIGDGRLPNGLLARRINAPCILNGLTLLVEAGDYNLLFGRARLLMVTPIGSDPFDAIGTVCRAREWSWPSGGCFRRFDHGRFRTVAAGVSLACPRGSA
jgi:hypothetical protein